MLKLRRGSDAGIDNVVAMLHLRFALGPCLLTASLGRDER